MNAALITFLAPNPVALQKRTTPAVTKRCRKPFQARIGERTLGVDYGLRRIGLAVSVGISPRPLMRVEHNRDPKRAADAVAKAAIGAVASTIIVGMPLNSDGAPGEQALATRVFLDYLVSCAPWARIMHLDERFTTADAKAVLHKAGIAQTDMHLFVDSAAAVVLLERYFSDRDDSLPVVFHAPGDADARCDTVHNVANDRPSYAEWKAQIIARAKSM